MTRDERWTAYGIQITQEVIDKHRWYAFWDAPLVVPGTSANQSQAGRGQLPVPAGRVYGLPRTPQEIRRASASFTTSSCAVKTDGGSLAVSFPGLSMGIFAGSLRFTVYRGTNLLQMDALAKTDEPWVAYKYDAGLKGFSTALTPAVKWHDTGGRLQQYRLGGPAAQAMSGLRAANRIIVAEGQGASLAAFPPPHTFFFTREKDTNLGYVWYRKDADTKFGIGIRMPEAEEDPQYALNFALYNAPPGTWQKMSVFFFAAADWLNRRARPRSPSRTTMRSRPFRGTRRSSTTSTWRSPIGSVPRDSTRRCRIWWR
jgi:hypothetical protein